MASKGGSGFDSGFDTDLGYLDRFFLKLEGHAQSLGPAEGARLRMLMGEERARWQEIRGLVGGAPTQTATAVDVPPPRRGTQQRAKLTVGTLRR